MVEFPTQIGYVTVVEVAGGGGGGGFGSETDIPDQLNSNVI